MWMLQLSFKETIAKRMPITRQSMQVKATGTAKTLGIKNLKLGEVCATSGIDIKMSKDSSRCSRKLLSPCSTLFNEGRNKTLHLSI
jgi:hypothetical protein